MSQICANEIQRFVLTQLSIQELSRRGKLTDLDLGPEDADPAAAAPPVGLDEAGILHLLNQRRVVVHLALGRQEELEIFLHIVSDFESDSDSECDFGVGKKDPLL